MMLPVLLVLPLLLAPEFEKVDFRGSTDDRVRLLKHKVGAVRARAAMLLEYGDRDRSIAALLVALSDPDASVRTASARTLGAWGDERATPFLARAMRREKDPRVLRHLLLAIGSCGDTYVARAVAEYLDHPVQEVRIGAVAALGKLADARQRAGLWAVFRFAAEDPDFVVRSSVLGAFVELGWKKDAQQAVVELEKAGALKLWRPRVAIVLAVGGIRWRERADWLKKLRDAERDPRVLAAAAGALSRLGYRDDLLRWVDHEDAGVRKAALLVLEDAGDSRAKARAVQLVRSDPDVSVRFTAAMILHRTGHAEANVYLVDALRSNDVTIWITALAALEKKYGQEFGRNPSAWTEFFKKQN